MRGAGTLRNTSSPPVRFTAKGCYRCLEATPRRNDAARTHLVKDCPFPPNQGITRPVQPSYRVVLFPDYQSEQQQMGSVSIGNNINQDQVPELCGNCIFVILIKQHGVKIHQ